MLRVVVILAALYSLIARAGDDWKVRGEPQSIDISHQAALVLKKIGTWEGRLLLEGLVRQLAASALDPIELSIKILVIEMLLTSPVESASAGPRRAVISHADVSILIDYVLELSAYQQVPEVDLSLFRVLTHREAPMNPHWEKWISALVSRGYLDQELEAFFKKSAAVKSNSEYLMWRNALEIPAMDARTRYLKSSRLGSTMSRDLFPVDLTAKISRKYFDRYQDRTSNLIRYVSGLGIMQRSTPNASFAFYGITAFHYSNRIARLYITFESGNRRDAKARLPQGYETDSIEDLYRFRPLRTLTTLSPAAAAEFEKHWNLRIARDVPPLENMLKLKSTQSLSSRDISALQSEKPRHAVLPWTRYDDALGLHCLEIL